jgi:apolipoprotein N-acyltransferase
VSEQIVLHDTVGRRHGTTPYTRYGQAPALAVAFAGLASGWIVARRRRAPAAEAGEDTPEPDAATLPV